MSEWIAKCEWCGQTKPVFASKEGEDKNGNVKPIPQCKTCYYEQRGEDVPKEGR